MMKYFKKCTVWSLLSLSLVLVSCENTSTLTESERLAREQEQKVKQAAREQRDNEIKTQALLEKQKAREQIETNYSYVTKKHMEDEIKYKVVEHRLSDGTLCVIGIRGFLNREEQKNRHTNFNVDEPPTITCNWNKSQSQEAVKPIRLEFTIREIHEDRSNDSE